MDEIKEMHSEIAHLARLALSERADDVRLFIARLVRKYRGTNPQLAEQMELLLKSTPARTNSTLRDGGRPTTAIDQPLPMDDESRLSLLKVFQNNQGIEKPLLSPHLEETLEQLIQERQQSERLISLGLQPARSAIFVGSPGVGKTLTARWLAARLKLPLYILDLTAVMSSLLGKTGTNLRAATEFAKRTSCILLLDEIDAVAKRRSDDADIGELKRLVTVMLQEVEEWPVTGLLLAATNHPELIDPALWRRFDLVIQFPMPTRTDVSEAVKRFFGPDLSTFQQWIDILTIVFSGQSFSDIERSIQRFRRAVALGNAPASVVVEEFVRTRAETLNRRQRIELAVSLAATHTISQHSISAITRVSRDTIRKHISNRHGTRRGDLANGAD